MCFVGPRKVSQLNSLLHRDTSPNIMKPGVNTYFGMLENHCKLNSILTRSRLKLYFAQLILKLVKISDFENEDISFCCFQNLYDKLVLI